MTPIPVSQLPQLHQDLIKSWATKKPMPTVMGGGSRFSEIEAQNIKRAIASFVTSHATPVTGSSLIARFGGRKDKTEKVLAALNQLIQEGVIQRDGLWYRKV